MKINLIRSLFIILCFSMAGFAQEKSADSFENLFNSGKKLFEDGFYAADSQKLQKAILLNQKNAEAYYFLGASYYNLDLYLEAIKNYEEAIKLKPDYFDALVYLGNALDFDNRFDEAVISLELTQLKDI